MRSTISTRIKYGLNAEFIKPSFKSGYSRLYDYYLDTIQEDLMTMQFKYPGDDFQPEPYVKKKITYVPPFLKKGKMRTKLENQRALDLTLPQFITPYTIPRFHRITLELINLKANEDKFSLLGSFLIIQTISGTVAETVLSTGGDHMIQVRAGKPIGCKTTLTGEKMYTFLDKLIENVFPKIKDWAGLVLKEESRVGKVSFEIKKDHIGLFPDIEPLYDNLPSLDGFKVIVETTAGTKQNVELLFNSFQIPLNIAEVKDEIKDNADPTYKFNRTKHNRN